MLRSVALVICAFTAAVPVGTDMLDALVTGAFTVNAPVVALLDKDTCCALIGPPTVIPVGALIESGAAVVRLAPGLMVNVLPEFMKTLDDPAEMGALTVSAPFDPND